MCSHGFNVLSREGELGSAILVEECPILGMGEGCRLQKPWPYTTQAYCEGGADPGWAGRESRCIF